MAFLFIFAVTIHTLFMQVIFILIAAAYTTFYLAVNLTSLTKIISLSLYHNSFKSYWKSFHSECVSGKSQYAVIIGFIIALLLFLVIIPVIIIRRVVYNKQSVNRKESGLIFNYSKSYPTENNSTIHFYTNIQEVGFKDIRVPISGNTKKDFKETILKFQTFKKDHPYTLIEHEEHKYMKLGDDYIKFPLLITINNSPYPVYFIYTKQHEKQFSSIKQILKTNGVDKVICFSVFPITSQSGSEVIKPSISLA
ncbi:hypothetical protein [Flavobacterium beibuense]|nr:hypothetical protein [Flavobacterium beibuense]